MILKKSENALIVRTAGYVEKEYSGFLLFCSREMVVALVLIVRVSVWKGKLGMSDDRW